MTYRELIEICYNNDYCMECRYLKECLSFKNRIGGDIPCDFYKLLVVPEFSFDDEIEVEE